MIKRLYILEYDMYSGIDGKYGNKKPERILLTYQYKERQNFIDVYLRVKNDDIHYENIRTYCVDYEYFEMTDKMNKVILAV